MFVFFNSKIYSVLTDIVSLIVLMSLTCNVPEHCFNYFSSNPSKQGLVNRMFHFNRQSVCLYSKSL